MKRTFFTVFGLASTIFLISCDIPINRYEPKNEDEKMVVALLNEYCDARNSGDLKRLQSTFHDDGVYKGGHGGAFTKVDFYQIDWKEEKVELYNLDININDSSAKVTATAKYHSGTWKTTHVYMLTLVGDKWLIMEKDHY
jgi:hypothetical protein